MLASLNHPHIASVFGLVDEGGVRGLVMELVEGPTLDERLASGALPWREALACAASIAEALEAAHDKGTPARYLARFTYDVAALGQRFLVGRPTAVDPTPPIAVPLNWQALLKR